MSKFGFHGLESMHKLCLCPKYTFLSSIWVIGINCSKMVPRRLPLPMWDAPQKKLQKVGAYSISTVKNYPDKNLAQVSYKTVSVGCGQSRDCASNNDPIICLNLSKLPFGKSLKLLILGCQSVIRPGPLGGKFKFLVDGQPACRLMMTHGTRIEHKALVFRQARGFLPAEQNITTEGD